MYSTLHGIFADKTGGTVFTCFSLWHFFYIFLTIGTIALVVWRFKNKEQCAKDLVLRIVAGIAFGLYMLDFFAMPLAYGEIDVDKLPFHACTSMSILCFASRNSKFLRKYRLHFAMLGMLSNLMYLCYPSGVMSYEIHPLSYRAVQTLLFHSALVVHGVLTLVLDDVKPSFKRSYRDAALLGIMTLWAIIGNAVYSGEVAEVGYKHDFNWFFVKADPFGILSEEIALYLAPFLNFVAFFGLELLICLGFSIIRKRQQKKEPAQS
ncbi:MAG: YwaF family protein [Clostridia bacterium]|nr:YwaF family protein [Clostridia bacterium]